MLTENEINRLIDIHSQNGFAIISACRDEYSEQENNHRTNILNDLIKKEGFSYKKIIGGYIENIDLPSRVDVKEKSFIVYNFKKDKPAKRGDLLKFAMRMCRKFNQDSVLYSEKGDKPRYYTKKGRVDGSFSKDSFTLNDKNQEYFSEFGDNKRFTLNYEDPEYPKTANMQKKARMATYHPNKHFDY